MLPSPSTSKRTPATAFALVTGETERWWRRGPKYRIAGRNPGIGKFEPDVGGRLIEAFDNQVFTTGTITASTWIVASAPPENSSPRHAHV